VSSEAAWPNGSKLGKEASLVGPLLNIAHLVPIRLQTWPPQAILISEWLISKTIFSEAALPNEPKHGKKHPCKVLYKDCS
jgi:hypothetical protein